MPFAVGVGTAELLREHGLGDFRLRALGDRALDGAGEGEGGRAGARIVGAWCLDRAEEVASAHGACEPGGGVVRFPGWTRRH